MKCSPVFSCGIAVAWSVVSSVGLCAAQTPAADSIVAALTKLHDDQVALVLDARSGSGRGGMRGTGGTIMALAAAHANPASRYHHDRRLLAPMEELADVLIATQNPSGLYDGGNLDSPPDTGFMIETLCKAQRLLLNDGRADTVAVRNKLEQIIRKSAEGLVVGGVHTPNHRWAVCAALAHIHDLYPQQRLVARIDEWLAEGVDVDADGQWAERSPNYTAAVNNPGMVHLALLLNRPQLLDYVRRNLEMTIYHVEVNGEVETVASRRQDQAQRARKYIWEYYIPYRLLAIRDGNGRFAAMARRIERDFLPELAGQFTDMNSPLVYLLEFPEMAKPLPPEVALETSYAKVFPKTAMARIRRDDITATVFGGNDWHLGFGVGSGLSTNPAFFKMRKGAAVLDSVRMTPGFFNTGFFFPQGLKVVEGGYQLEQKLQVPYHLPMPPEKRRPSGEYDMAPDMGTLGLHGRYFSKLGFADRPMDLKTLNSKVTVRENAGRFTLEFDVQGYDDVPVTIELCFRPGGVLTGVEPAGGAAGGRGGRGGPSMAGDPDSFVLKDGFGTYTVDGTTIRFGPGINAHMRLSMEGEPYSVYHGNLRAEGQRVYLTGVTPFRYTLTLE